MAKKNKFTTKDLDNLYEIYDKARADAKEAEADKKEAGDAIREKLGETTEATTQNYVVTYKYDADKDVEQFDEEAFETKDPKGHAEYIKLLEKAEAILSLSKIVAKKFMKTVTVKGARKLVVTRQEAEE